MHTRSMRLLPTVLGVLSMALATLVVAGCRGSSTPESRPHVRSVTARVETAPFAGRGDIADDSAIWVDREHPSRTVVIADDKSGASKGGGIGVFDMHGRLLSFRRDGKIGNVDLRNGFRVRGRSRVLVGANNRTDDTISLWTLDPAKRRLGPLSLGVIETEDDNYGFCLYHSRVSGRFYAFVTSKEDGPVQQYLLAAAGKRVTARLVRTLPLSSTAESCVADDSNGALYVGQEDVAVWRYGAEPDAGRSRRSVDRVGRGNLVADVEGMAVAAGPGDAGYLLVSSQGDSRIAVYRRGGRNAFVARFGVEGARGVDKVTDSDGLDVTTSSAGPGFEDGLLVVHDGHNTGGNVSNLKYVRFADVLASLRRR